MVATVLCDSGANVNAQDKNASTPLHLAARRDKQAVIEVLLSTRADINVRDKNGIQLCMWRHGMVMTLRWFKLC